MEKFDLLELDYKPKVNSKHDYGIGIIGSGGIVQNVHIPAYKKAGFNIIGVNDKDYELAISVAQRFNIPKVFKTWEELVSSEDIEVVDIALPPGLNPNAVKLAAEAKKHILVQKPMAFNLKDALEIVSVAETNKIKLAVNQNGRWDPAIRASKILIDKGILGKRLFAYIKHINVEGWQKYLENKGKREKLMLINTSVHHIDQLRFLFGNPVLVDAFTVDYPKQKYFGEAIVNYRMEYKDDFFAMGLDDGVNYGLDNSTNFRFNGTEGVIKGNLGNPEWNPSHLKFISKKYGDIWYEPRFETRWMPDGFIGTMAGLFTAIDEDIEPKTSGKDNINTLKVIFACYKSAKEKRRVSLEEIEKDDE